MAIFVVTVNDIFVVEAWKKHLCAGKETDVHFLSDSTGTTPRHRHFRLCRVPASGWLADGDGGDPTGAYVNALGMGFDASGLLGNTRSKRFVAVVEDGVVQNLFVEDEAPNITSTAAEKVLATF